MLQGTYSEPSRRRDFWEKKLPNHNGSSFPYPPLPKVTDREILREKAVDSAHGSQGKSRSGKQIPVSRIPDNAKADIFAKDVIQESKQPKKPLDKTTNRAPSPSSRQTPASPRPILPDSTLGHPPEMAQLVGATTGSWIKSLDDIASTEIPHPASWDEQHLGRAGEAVSEVVSAGSSRDETIVEPKAVEDEVNVGHQGVPENAIDEQALLEDDPVSENARLQDEEDLENEQDLLEDDQAIEEDQALLEDDQVLEDEQARLEDEQELEDEQDLLADEQAMEDERALLEDAQALENVRELLENEQDADEEQALLEDEPALEPVQAVLEDGDALEDEQDLLEDEQSVQDEQALLEHEQALEDEQELLEEEEGLEDDQDVLEDKEAGEDEQALLEDERALEDEQSLLPEERGKPETVKRVAEDPETVAEERSDPPLRDITRRWGSVHTASDPLVEEGEGVESDEQKLMAKNRELPSSDHDERTRLGLTDDERRRTRLSPAPRRAYLTKMDYIQLTTLDEVLEHVNRGGEPVAERQAAVPQQRQRARRVRERQEGAALSQHQDLVSEARRELGAAKEEPARVDAPAEGSKSSKSSARQRRLAADDEEMRAFAEAIEGRMQDAPKLRLASSARFSIGTPDPEPPTEGARTAAAGGLRSGGLERPENMQSDRVGRLPGLHAFGRADGWDQKLRQKAEAGWELRMKLKVQASRVATALRERASQANRPPVRPRPKGQGARIGRNLLMAVKKV
ncbi:hypothetical protein CALVIDRAFT_197798 [Calocera viscosa TUFC12733]|uniref:Uncharacterized protein n=1 Tax=Calocera viscosa (strain TUFC12733) TaxID=1330018 RepID=A0A167KIT0_CALVF|nr:hypothetical protein CALVIDRAFT_197798 [Calocera viscosa TUFC12733]